ncbi:MAG: MFS transporter [Clostridia bacterium]|nr:MFS transporter [Clostridia bacterium]
MSAKTLNYTKTKYACYYAYLSMASAYSLPPLLFVTFRDMYGISYTLLGALVLINFCTQLLIDLIFSFFTKYFNIRKVAKTMPLITSVGFLIYALVPTFFPRFAYAGLVAGTLVFSVAAGLCEVLMSPMVASLPSDNPERDMSMLHSLYAWGVLMVVIITTVFQGLFGRENWMYLTIFLALLPLLAAYLFATSPIPEMHLDHSSGGAKAKNRTIGLALCTACIFLGSAAENTMSNWISGYMENALHIPKTLGDIFGLALFAVLLGLVRTLYAKYGRNISAVLLAGMVGATVCYLIIGLSNNNVLCFVACVLVGLVTSMLWPGTLILMEERIPAPGVAAYALMAAGGDVGASVAPQLLGIVVDNVSASEWAVGLGATLSLSAEQIGMKVGMLVAGVFPFLGIFLLLYIKHYFKKNKLQKGE